MAAVILRRDQEATFCPGQVEGGRRKGGVDGCATSYKPSRGRCSCMDLVRRDRDQLAASHIGDAKWRGLRKGEIAANVNVTKVGRDCLGSKQYGEVYGKVVGM